MLPNGTLQADMPGGPVFSRLDQWIKQINELPNCSRASAITSEIKRIKYMGVPLACLIRDYKIIRQGATGQITENNDASVVVCREDET